MFFLTSVVRVCKLEDERLRVKCGLAPSSRYMYRKYLRCRCGGSQERQKPGQVVRQKEAPQVMMTPDWPCGEYKLLIVPPFDLKVI